MVLLFPDTFYRYQPRKAQEVLVAMIDAYKVFPYFQMNIVLTFVLFYEIISSTDEAVT